MSEYLGPCFVAWLDVHASILFREKRKYYLKIANRIHDAVVELSIEVDQELQRKRELE